MNTNTPVRKLRSFHSSWKQNGSVDLLPITVWPRPQPSVRVPVTPGNRDYLRKLRAAESAAWEAVKPGALSAYRTENTDGG